MNPMRFEEMLRENAPLWMGVDALLDFDYMPDSRTLWEQGYLTDCRPRTRVFVSHRWIDGEADPTGEKWRRLRKAFSKCAEKPSIDAAFFKYDDEYPPRYGHLVRRVEGACGIDFRVASAAEDLAEVIRSGTALNQLYKAHHDARSPGYYDSVRKEAESARQELVPKVRRQLGIWLDYCCMPQGKNSPADTSYREWLLPRVTVLANQSFIIGLWSEEELRQSTWCFAELTLNRSTGIPRAITVDEEGTLNDVTEKSISACVDLIEKAKSESDIRKWFEAKNMYSSDLVILSKAIYAAVCPGNKLGFRYVLYRGCLIAVEAVWWLACGGVALLHHALGVMTMAAAGDPDSDERPSSPIRRGWRSSLAEIWWKIRSLLRYVILMQGLIWRQASRFMLAPGSLIEPFRQVLFSFVLKGRADFVAKVIDKESDGNANSEDIEYPGVPSEWRRAPDVAWQWPSPVLWIVGTVAGSYFALLRFDSMASFGCFMFCVALVNYVFVSWGVFSQNGREFTDKMLACLRLTLAFVAFSGLAFCVVFVFLVVVALIWLSPASMPFTLSVPAAPLERGGQNYPHSLWGWAIAVSLGGWSLGFSVAVATGIVLLPGLACTHFCARMAKIDCDSGQMAAIIYSFVTFVLFMSPEAFAPTLIWITSLF